MATEDSPTLADVLALLQQNIGVNTHAVKHGIVRSFDRKAGVGPRATIQLQAKMVTGAGEPIEIQPIENVYVCEPKWGPLSLQCDLEPGDGVLCMVMDRAFEGWLRDGRPYAPIDGRVHNLNDIVVLPVFRANKDQPKQSPGTRELLISDDSGQLKVAINAADFSVKVECLTAEIKATATATVEGTGSATVKSSGPVTIESPTVMLSNPAGLGPFPIARVGVDTVLVAGAPVPISPGPLGPSLHTVKG